MDFFFLLGNKLVFYCQVEDGDGEGFIVRIYFLEVVCYGGGEVFRGVVEGDDGFLGWILFLVELEDQVIDEWQREVCEVGGKFLVVFEESDFFFVGRGRGKVFLGEGDGYGWVFFFFRGG